MTDFLDFANTKLDTPDETLKTPAAPESAGDDFLDFANSRLPDNEALRQSLTQAASANPQEEAKKQRLARGLGVSPDLLMPDAESEMYLKLHPADAIAAKAPAAAKLLEDGQKAGLFKNEIPALQDLDNLLTGLTPAKVGGAALGGLVRNVNVPAFGIARAISDVLPLPEQVSEYFAEKQAQAALVAGTVEPDVAKAGAYEKGAYQGVGSAAGMVPALVGGVYAAAGKGALAISNWVTNLMAGATAGSEYGTARDAGEGTFKSMVYALAQGGVEKVTEMLPELTILKGVTGETGLLKAAGNFFVQDIGGEQVATIWQDFNSWVVLNPTKTIDEFMAERPEAAKETFAATLVAGGLQVGGMGGLRAIHEHRAAKAQKAEGDMEKLKRISKIAGESQVRKDDPESFHEAIAQMSDATNLREIYIDAETLSQAFAKEGGQELLQKMPQVAAQMGEALATKGDVRVSVADYATHIAGSEFDAAVLPKIRTSEGGMTFDESKVFFQTQKEEMAVQAEEISAAQEPVLSREEFDAMQATVPQERRAKTERRARASEQEFAPVGTQDYTEALDNANSLLAQGKEIIEGKQRGPDRRGADRRQNEATRKQLQEMQDAGVYSDTQVEKLLELARTRPVAEMNARAAAQEKLLLEPNTPDRGRIEAEIAAYDAVIAKHAAAFEEAAKETPAQKRAKVKLPKKGINVPKPGMSYEDYLKAHPNQRAVQAADVQKVHDVIFKGFAATKRYTKAVVELNTIAIREFYVRQAARAGISPFALYQKFPVNFGAVGTGGFEQLEGLPDTVIVDGAEMKFSEFQPARDAAREYMAKAGLPYTPVRKYVKVDRVRAERIAAEFEKMKHDPENPEVKAAYEALAKEALAQWEIIKATGFRAEFIGAGVDVSGTAVADAEGKPLTVYRGTRKDAAGQDVQFFSADAKYARQYGDTLVSAQLNIREPKILTNEEYWQHIRAGTEKAVISEAREAGYDGIIVRGFQDNLAPADMFIVVRKGQINSLDDPYGNPRNAIKDIVENNHMWVYPTDAGYGADRDVSQDASKHPMLAIVPGEEISGRPVRVNDIFRIVHDYFGHAKEGVGFRADGEENAWRIHSAMFSPLARRALTTETRGQNSWLNFGPHGEANRKAKTAETVFAEQKAGLMPEWVSNEGVSDGVSVIGVHFSKEKRAVLHGEKYGTGIAGAEAKRLKFAEDPRIKTRIAFYVDEGQGVFPEQGVGTARHEVALDNLYDGAANPLGLPSKDKNEFESAVLNAGFSGYYVRAGFNKQGVAVLLGDAAKAVPVPSEYAQKAVKQELNPEVVKILGPIIKHLTPQERAKLRKDTATKLVDIFTALPKIDEMAAVAYAGRAKRGWYARSADALVDIFGPDAPRFAALLASMSPQTSVEINLRNALNTWANWVQAGRPQTKHEIAQIMGRSVEGNKLTESVLPNWIPNSVRSLTTEDPTAIVLSGPKVNSFMLNLRGVVEEVTNDAWMSNYALVDQTIFKGALNVAGDEPGKGPGYLAMSARVRAAAKRLSTLTGDEWTPAEVQETVWSWAKTVYELQVKGAGATDVLAEGKLTPELIAATPDFRSLLTEDRNENILRAAGYGERLNDILRRAGIADAGAQQEADIAGGKTAPFTEEAQRTHEFRAARRLEELKAQREQEYGQFAGSSALVSDALALGTAKQRIANGEDAEQVRKDTGWFVGPDDSWRFEISDKEATLRSSNRSFNDWFNDEYRESDTKVITVGRLLRHPKLFAAYPALADIRLTDTLDGLGGWDAKNNIILINSDLVGDDIMDTLLHELQHAIQHLEDFATGGSLRTAKQVSYAEQSKVFAAAIRREQQAGKAVPEVARISNEIYMLDLNLMRKYGIDPVDADGFRNDKAFTAMVAAINQEDMAARNKLYEAYEDAVSEAGGYQAEAVIKHRAASSALFQAYPTAIPDREAFKIYRRIAGEVEARNTSARRRLSEEDRTMFPPSMTADVPSDRVYIVRNGKLALSLPTPANAAPLEQQQRGSFNPATLAISFTSAADLSTPLHETGHLYLELLTGMANQADAPQEIKDDVAKVMNWFGVTLDQWNAMSLEEKRPHHEQWAESYERYLLEGKAPSVELRPVFARFTQWLTRVYKSVKDFVDAHPAAGKLNKEIRGVFDRMLASEEAITAVQTLRGYEPLLPASEVPEAFADYFKTGEQATAEAVADMEQRSLGDMKWLSGAKSRALKELQAKANAQRAAIRSEVEAQVSAEPIYQAITQLRAKDSEIKLYTVELKAMLPNLDVTKLRGMTSTENGTHPDQVAQMFGFSSGEMLINEILAAEDMQAKIDGMTDQRMLEEHGELIDTRAVEAAANAAVHNEARAKFLATGLKILEMKGKADSGISATALAKAAKAAAESAISGKRVRDIRPAQYEAAESRANKEAIKLAPKKPVDAIAAQRASLLNNRLAKAAHEAQSEVEKALRYLKKFTGEGTRKNLDLEYLEQIDAMLAPFDLSVGLTLTEIERRKTLADWIAKQEAMGFEPAIDADQVELSKRKSYKDMTMDELRGFIDAVKQVEHLGRLKKKLLTAKDAREFAERIDEATASILDNATRTVKERGTPSDIAGMTGQWFRTMAASHRKFASVIREMDGGHDNGVMANLLLYTMNDAGNAEVEMRAKAAQDMARLFEPVLTTVGKDGRVVARKRPIAGTGLSMTNEQRLMFALNWGNEGNRQRLLDGGIAGYKSLSQNEAQRILDTLDKKEWDFVQSVWDHLDTYRPMIAAQERALTGVEPEWVQPSPIVTKHGTYKGGYFPAKYDAMLSTRSESLEAATNLRQAMKGAFNASATRKGYTQKRADEVHGRPLLLSFNAISQHVSEVTHRLAWQEWVTDANRVLKALDGVVRETYGPELLKAMRDTVKDIAEGDAPANGPVERAINHIRIGSTVVGMGWRVTTALLQPSGLAQSWVRIGGRHIARGLKEFMASPLKKGDWVNEKSTFMRERGRTMQREINEVLNVVRAGEKTTAVKASYFLMIAKMQRMVDMPTWLGAYEKALEELQYERSVDDNGRSEIENQAVKIADQAVLDSQGGGQLKDLAGVQRGSPALKLFTNFYSYFNVTYNMNVEAFRRTKFTDPSAVGALAVDLALLNTVPVLFSMALKEMLKGNCEWDTECLAKRLGTEQLNYLFGQMILLREAGTAVSAAAGEGYGYTGPAGLRFFADLYKLGQQAGQEEADLALFKAANSVGGTLLHYPAGQINSTVEGIMAIENGDVEGVNIFSAVIAGKQK